MSSAFWAFVASRLIIVPLRDPPQAQCASTFMDE
jgi:hypothetical protein